MRARPRPGTASLPPATVHYWLHTTCYSLLTTHHSPLTTHHSPLNTDYLTTARLGTASLPPTHPSSIASSRHAASRT
eukprot:scaffold11128_cov69-Phaeocystis_antarctica.AAC.1